MLLPRQCDIDLIESSLARSPTHTHTYTHITARKLVNQPVCIIDLSRGHMEEVTNVIDNHARSPVLAPLCWPTMSYTYALTAWVTEPFKRFTCQSASPNSCMHQALGAVSPCMLGNRQATNRRLLRTEVWRRYGFCPALITDILRNLVMHCLLPPPTVASLA